jgi:hypothetical protein
MYNNFRFFHYFLTYSCSMVSGLTLAEMSVDRFIAIRYPMAAQRICTTTKAKTTIIITAVVFTAVNVSAFFCHVRITDEVSGKMQNILKHSFPCLQWPARSVCHHKDRPTRHCVESSGHCHLARFH